ANWLRPPPEGQLKLSKCLVPSLCQHFDRPARKVPCDALQAQPPRLPPHKPPQPHPLHPPPHDEPCSRHDSAAAPPGPTSVPHEVRGRQNRQNREQNHHRPAGVMPRLIVHGPQQQVLLPPDEPPDPRQNPAPDS